MSVLDFLLIHRGEDAVGSHAVIRQLLKYIGKSEIYQNQDFGFVCPVKKASDIVNFAVWLILRRLALKTLK